MSKMKKKKVRWVGIEPGDFFGSVVRFNLWRTRSQAGQSKHGENKRKKHVFFVMPLRQP